MADVTHIPVDVRNVDQLFSSFDPSPFHEHSLNSTAAQYLASQAWYAPRGATFLIELKINGKPAPPRAVQQLQSVVSDHFARMAANEAQNFRKLIRTGLISLCIGLFVLAVCTALSRGVDNMPIPDGWREGIRDGISMFGWVANWRPAQILFYDWWPVRRSRNLYRRLAHAGVVAGRGKSGRADPENDAPIDSMPIEAGPT